MDIVLFLIGVVMFATGRFRLASLQTAGRHVRAAGVLLMLPGTVNFLLGIVLVVMYGADFDAIFAVFDRIAPLMLIGMLIAVGLAYIMIADPPGVPRLPGVLGRIQAERRASQTSTTPPQSAQPAPAVAYPQRTFGTILSVNEAAEYMKVSPQQVMDWIEAGKLPAARDSNGYRIARSRLDELRSE